jgi:transforming growth factor-beta-induced protein
MPSLTNRAAIPTCPHIRIVRPSARCTQTLEGKNVEVYIRPPFSIYINNARVLTADIEASNGVVHIVDAVIMMPTPPPTPPPTPATLYDVARANPDLSTFISVIDKAGLTAVLKGGLSHGTNITVYAPTNDAFASLRTADLDYLLNNPGALLSVLTYVFLVVCYV